MGQINNRTLALVVLLAFILLLIINPNGLMYTLGIIQSLVIITLGIVATMYLWKRM